MADLSGVLGQVPFLAGWKGTDQLREQEKMGQLAQAQNLMGILSAAQAQQQRQAELEKERAFRTAIQGATTDDQRAVIASQFGGPKEILAHVDRVSGQRATAEMARARLQQAGTNATMMHEARMKGLSNQEERAKEIARHNGVMEMIQNEGLKLTGARVIYDTGTGSAAGVQLNPPRGAGAAPTSLTGVLSQPSPGMAPPQPTPGIAPAPTAPRVPSPADFPRRGPTDGLPQQLQIIQKEIADELALADQYRDNPQQAEVHRRNAQSLQSELAKIAPQTAPAPAQPNNFDARDLRLQQGALSAQNPQTLQGVLASAMPPPPQSVAPAQSPAQAPTMPQMPPEIASAPKRVQDKWRLDQTKSSIAGAGTLTPESLQFTAKQYLAGDRQSVQGFARNATARIALQNAIVDEAAKQGMSPQMVAAQIADFAGTMAGSRTVGQRAANINLAATEAQEMLGIVKEQSDKFPRENFIPWNMALKAYETNTGRPEVVAFGASVNALVNVYARAINPTGVPTVHDKQEARKVLDTVQSPPQVDAVLSIINRELEIAKKAPLTVRQATRNSITGNATPAAGAKPSAADFFK